MTTENKSIWHTPQERPIDGDCIVSPDGIVGEYDYDGGREIINCPNNHIEFMRHWKAYAHIDDLISASKALDSMWNENEKLKKQLAEFQNATLHLLKEQVSLTQIIKGDK